ncbi:hypothetical protein GA0070563_11186 [Micromonospora carbonacea]|uniref:Uncharacterized protein n=2 Tax=Micromonospora carbonacea TaxID=47853 RepID=A0A1C5A3Z4_9ACTN|nr:hypothetical protein GA0070563_11186 [Micromonospora carbonacea]
MGNETLRVAMAAVGETADSLAGKVRVDPKTAGRWVSQGRIPHARTRLAVAKVLGQEAADLWPEPFRRRDLPWFRKWAELEQVAVSIRSYQPLLVTSSATRSTLLAWGAGGRASPARRCPAASRSS